jgi:hypothetical protein
MMNVVDEEVDLERVVGIEPTLSAWEAEVLPLNYTRVPQDSRVSGSTVKLYGVPEKHLFPGFRAHIDFTSVPS